MPSQAAYLSQCLAQSVEAVCCTYLPGGRRRGRYWVAGDVTGQPGHSLYVRLSGPDAGPGAAGKWTDAATGDHGDLLDLIAANRGLSRMADILEEARAFLRVPHPRPDPVMARAPVAQGSSESAQRLFAASRPLPGTLAETYLRQRGLAGVSSLPALRFHPRCYLRPEGANQTLTLPALIAAVTDPAGLITGAHRTWLDPVGAGKAAIETPRRAMGHLLGNAVRFGEAQDVLAAGEGLETVLSLNGVLSSLPIAAALSANHLAAIIFPPGVRFLYILRDRDPAGDAAYRGLSARASAAGIAPLALMPQRGDFNEDLCHFGRDGLAAHLRAQLLPLHWARFSDGRS